MATTEQATDQLLLMLTQRCNGIENLLETFFSFLGRRTDFFNAPGISDPKKHLEYCVSMVSKTCREIGSKTIEAKLKEAEEKQKATEAKKAVRSQTQVIDATSDDPNKVIEVPRPKTFDVNDPAEEDEDSPGDEKEESALPGNGGSTECFVKMTKKPSDISASVPEGTKSRDIKVDITTTKLNVSVKGEQLFGGELHEPVKGDDCFWTLVDGKTLQITLEKRNGMQWWQCVIKGHASIDVKKIVPENSKLCDLDPETRSTVEKMMYDQRQKAAGLPTSDQAAQFEALEKFKKAHPELDFSKANINFAK